MDDMAQGLAPATPKKKGRPEADRPDLRLAAPSPCGEEIRQRTDWKVSTAAVTRSLMGFSDSFTEAETVSDILPTSAM